MLIYCRFGKLGKSMYLPNFGGGKQSVFSVARLDNAISKHIG